MTTRWVRSHFAQRTLPPLVVLVLAATTPGIAGAGASMDASDPSRGYEDVNGSPTLTLPAIPQPLIPTPPGDPRISETDAAFLGASPPSKQVVTGQPMLGWNEITPPPLAVSPGPLTAAASAYDEARDELVVFGGVKRKNSVDATVLGALGYTQTEPSTDTWIRDATGWHRAFPEHRPPARAAAGMAYHAGLGKTILFGGQDERSQKFSDTWAWDGEDWTQLQPAASPPALAMSAMAYNPLDETIVLFGGWDSNRAARGETWIFDGETWVRHSAGASPSARYYSALTYVPNLNRSDDGVEAASAGLLLVGGAGAGERFLNDTWLWDGAGWKELNPPTVPTADTWRYPLLAFDARINKVIALGTGADMGVRSEVWLWDGIDWEMSDAEAPFSRFDAVFEFHPGVGAAVLYGGAGCTNSGDEWIFDGETWTRLNEPGAPPARTYAAQALDTRRDRAVLFGGTTSPAGCWLTDTWEWDGTVWTRRPTASAPAARVWHSMAYDPIRRETVVFGGRGRPVDGKWTWLGDTWTYDGRTWTRRFSDEAPPPREGAGMAFDSTTGKIVLFGGTAVQDNKWLVFNDTWTWDGAAWSKEAPQTSPAPRSYISLTREPSGGPVLFGGCCAAGTDDGLADTWRWKGAAGTWEKVETGMAPPPRWGAGAAYDDASGKVVLFGGGLDIFTMYRDTWVFDGITWTPGATAPLPWQRMFPGFSDGSESKGPMMFGGGNLAPRDANTWTWSSIESLGSE